ncbi:hypothetical protein GOBAR_DD35600 [Gossypium barbadense]|nr:hypothetical protein GOBAR_DD35600 [Gossypium barbadense]
MRVLLRGPLLHHAFLFTMSCGRWAIQNFESEEIINTNAQEVPFAIRSMEEDRSKIGCMIFECKDLLRKREGIKIQ